MDTLTIRGTSSVTDGIIACEEFGMIVFGDRSKRVCERRAPGGHGFQEHLIVANNET
jgi:hypothetical protein